MYASNMTCVEMQSANIVLNPTEALQVVLIRGLPGCGKSTYAKATYPTYTYCDADEYFTDEDGLYKFNECALRDAHLFCLEKVEDSLQNRINVVVANTFSTFNEIQPYLGLVLG